MSLNRSEQQQTEHALRKGDKAREERISVAMGKEEAARVDHAQREAEIAGMIVVAIPAFNEGMESGIAQERARCLAICAQWPDNLMACHLAKLIASGK